jgi:ParB/RepB/Spo0J family partition protein
MNEVESIGIERFNLKLERHFQVDCKAPAGDKQEKTIDVRQIPLGSVGDGENALRDTTEQSAIEMKELVESVIKNGVLQPIGVCPDGDAYVPLFGFRRLFAARQAGHAHIPARILPQPADAVELLILQSQENIHRADVCPVRFGKIVKQIKDERNWTNTELGERLNLSAPKVTRLLCAAGMRPELQALVSNGTIGLSSAMELDRLTGQELAELLPKVVHGFITRDQLVHRRKADVERAGANDSSKVSRATAVLGEGRSITVAAPSLDLEGFIAALEILLLKARKSRPQGASLKTFIQLLRDQVDISDPQPVS